MIKQIKEIDSHHSCECGTSLIKFTDGSNEAESLTVRIRNGKGYWFVPEGDFQEGELVNVVLLEEVGRCPHCSWYYSIKVKKLSEGL